MRRWLRVACAGLALAAVLVLWRVRAYGRWRASLAAQGFFGELAGPRGGERIVIVAPHPDDEVLGCGGLIKRAVGAGAEVYVIVMTNGDASELALLFGEEDLPLSPKAYIKLGRRRQAESLRGLAELGVAPSRVYFLSYPNNGLVALWRPEHWRPADAYRSPYTKVERSPYRLSFTPGAVYCGAQVAQDLYRVLGQVRPDEIYVPHPQDIHPDHWGAAAFVAFAVDRALAEGAGWARSVRLYGYLIHWPHWPMPRAYRPELALVPPPNLPGARWLRLELEPEEVEAKARALWCYASQKPRADKLLASLVRRNEMFAPLRPPGIQARRLMALCDEAAVGRHMGAADVRAVQARVEGRFASGEVACGGRALPRRGYVAFDVRGWQGGRAWIVTAYLQGRRERVVRMWGESVDATWREARLSRDGAWQVGELELPVAAGSGPVMIDCWGSVADRKIDAAGWIWAPAMDLAMF